MFIIGKMEYEEKHKNHHNLITQKSVFSYMSVIFKCTCIFLQSHNYSVCIVFHMVLKTVW